MANQYIVQKGDNLWNIAKANGLSLAQLRKLNPNISDTIFPNQTINIEPTRTTQWVNIKDEQNRENELNKNNITAIQGYKHNSNYAIIDKKNKLISVYDKNNKLLYQTDGMSTGLSGHDYNTITYRKSNGQLENYAGNNSTPTGTLMINAKGTYHGVPNFIRARINPNTGEVNKVRDNNGNLVDDNVASSMHYGNTDKAYNSNGCIRLSPKAAQELNKYLQEGDLTHTLPTNNKSRFILRGGELNYVADNPYGNDTPGNKKRFWDDYNVSISKKYNPLTMTWKKTGKKIYDRNKHDFAATIVNSKQAFQKEFNLTSDEYNRLAQMAMGIAEQESKFGTAFNYTWHGWLTDSQANIGKRIRAFIEGQKISDNPARSKGFTQIKMSSDNKGLQQVYKKLGITNDEIEGLLANQPIVTGSSDVISAPKQKRTLSDKSILTAKGSALATMARLAYMYNTEVKGKNFKNNINEIINPYDALMYKWVGQNYKLTSGIARPKTWEYAQNVRKYYDPINMYEKRTYENY